MDTVDDKLVEDPRNFPHAPGVITLVRDTGGYRKVWIHLSEAKKAYPKIRVVQLDRILVRGADVELLDCPTFHYTW